MQLSLNPPPEAYGGQAEARKVFVEQEAAETAAEERAPAVKASLFLFLGWGELTT